MAEMVTLADAFEKEVAEEGELEPAARVVARCACIHPFCSHRDIPIFRLLMAQGAFEYMQGCCPPPCAAVGLHALWG